MSIISKLISRRRDILFESGLQQCRLVSHVGEALIVLLRAMLDLVLQLEQVARGLGALSLLEVLQQKLVLVRQALDLGLEQRLLGAQHA